MSLAEARPDAALAKCIADDVAALAGLGQLDEDAYVSAVGARFASEQSAEDAYLAERAAQSGWPREWPKNSAGHARTGTSWLPRRCRARLQ
ncbi:MAG: hypothetical protein JWN04_3741 [Myxococcaceae bacterium]|nr:hypothetical protein [Myxococcaceae bacterium]